jgi:hypothetical protein
MKILATTIIAIVILLCVRNAYSAEVEYALVLDGMDSLIAYDMDTTGHWWAVTKPFTSLYRMHINDYNSPASEDLTYPVFAPGGSGWSFFRVQNGNIHLVRNDNGLQIDTTLDATDFGEIVYSPDGSQFAYTYFQASVEVMSLPNANGGTRDITVTNRFGNLFIDNYATSYTIMGKRMDSYVININGKESTTYDSIIPIGYWHTGAFIYAAYNGGTWSIYRNDEELGSSYSNIISAKVNPIGTTLAVLVKTGSGLANCIVFNDDYWEPIYGKLYNGVWGLTLHPTELLYGYGASDGGRTWIVQNSTEYYTVGEVGTPFYSYNGSELIFISMGEFSPYINVNGKRSDIKLTLYPDDVIAKKPGSPTIALATEMTLLVYNYETNARHIGYMVDDMSKAIYNYRTNCYEALGIIDQRVYLLYYRM